MPFAQLYWPARSMANTLGNKEFDEEDFFVSGPTSLTYTSQAISGKVNKTLGTVKVALLDGFGNVMTMDTGGGASTISLSLVTPNNGGVLLVADEPHQAAQPGRRRRGRISRSRRPPGPTGCRADSSVRPDPGRAQPADQRHELTLAHIPSRAVPAGPVTGRAGGMIRRGGEGHDDGDTDEDGDHRRQARTAAAVRGRGRRASAVAVGPAHRWGADAGLDRGRRCLRAEVRRQRAGRRRGLERAARDRGLRRRQAR